MIERLDFVEAPYKAIEASVHLNRYFVAKNLCKDKVVLDAACGEGYGTYLLSKWGAKKAVGVDISESAVAHAQEVFGGEKLEFFCNTVEKLAMFPNNSFDMVVSFETIEHIQDPIAFLKEIKRIVKPDGIVVISCPNDYCYYPSAGECNPFHVRKYTKDEFKEQTTSVLGAYSHFVIGAPAAGFINISESVKGPQVPETQVKMLHYRSLNNSIIVPQDHVVDEKNCSYFIALWGAYAAELTENAAIYPCGLNQYSFYEKAEIINASNEQADSSARYRYIIQELAGELRRRIALDEGADAQELSKKLLELLQHESANTDLEVQCARKCVEMEYKVSNYRVLYEGVLAENQFIKECDRKGLQSEKDLQEIYNSKGYKLLRKWYNLKDRLKKIKP